MGAVMYTPRMVAGLAIQESPRLDIPFAEEADCLERPNLYKLWEYPNASPATTQGRDDEDSESATPQVSICHRAQE